MMPFNTQPQSIEIQHRERNVPSWWPRSFSRTVGEDTSTGLLWTSRTCGWTWAGQYWSGRSNPGPCAKKGKKKKTHRVCETLTAYSVFHLTYKTHQYFLSNKLNQIKRFFSSYFLLPFWYEYIMAFNSGRYLLSFTIKMYFLATQGKEDVKEERQTRTIVKETPLSDSLSSEFNVWGNAPGDSLGKHFDQSF